MLCKRPFMGGAVPFGCGQCLPCRINRRRQWMWRQFLESLCHDENCFITLTYSEKNLPEGGSLDKNVVSGTIKRIRRVIAPLRIRYFYVGEYGEQTYRPHYHISMFGVSGHTVCEVQSGSGSPIGIRFDAIVDKEWGLGYTSVHEFNELTAQYVAGYVVKKLTTYGDPRLQGRTPEFARMSRRPGLGAGAMGIIAKTLCESGHGMALIEDTGDVPHEVRIGRRRIPLGRYLLRRLREAVGFTPEYIAHIRQTGAYDKSVEMLALLQGAQNNAPVGTVKEVYLGSIIQKVRQVEGRASLHRKRGTL